MIREAAVRRLLAVVALAVGAVVAPAPAPASYADRAVTYPAYHRVQSGESMWSIAREFLQRATGKSPANLVVDHEVRQMRRLNRDTLHGSDRIRPGQRLLLAPTNWDVPDGTDGWGTGFTWCTNDRVPAHPSAPYRGLTLRIRLLKAPVDRRSEPVRVILHNGSDRTRRFTTQLEHGLLVPGDGSPTAVMHSDAIGVAEWTMPPGATRHVDGSVARFVCGDTRYLDRRLPTGRYRLYGVVAWGRADRSRGEWLTSRDVRVR